MRQTIRASLLKMRVTLYLPTGLPACLPTCLLAAWMLFLPQGNAQIPGSRDILTEFPEFTQEENEERRDTLDFEYSRVVALALHGGYNFLMGGLAQTVTNGATVDVSLNYFMYTQSAVVLSVGTAFAGIHVNGLQSYADLDGVKRENQPLRLEGSVSMYRFTAGYRYYFGHPAFPNVFSFLGLNTELSGGILLRLERYSILEDGPRHPGLTFFSDISPIFILSMGVEFPFLLESVNLGLRAGYQLSFLSDESRTGFVGEPRNGDWLPISAYIMVHLD